MKSGSKNDKPQIKEKEKKASTNTSFSVFPESNIYATKLMFDTQFLFFLKKMLFPLKF